MDSSRNMSMSTMSTMTAISVRRIRSLLIKTISRHIWEEYLETSEDIRYTLGNKEIYMLRKETIERLFGSAKEQHGFRYTQYIGNARMRMKAGLTFACMNLKKLAKILDVRERQDKKSGFFFIFYKKYGSWHFGKKSGAGVRLQHQLCLQSEAAASGCFYLQYTQNAVSAILTPSQS